MVCIITGDIINSKNNHPEKWLIPLKKELNKWGKSPESWEIFRGDSFQCIIKKPEEALLAAISLKAAMKSIKNTNVRMALGLGEISYSAQSITESNGSAFVFSGEKFEMLRQEKQNLAIKSADPQWDKEINLYLKLILLVMDNWTVSAAEAVWTVINEKNKSQEHLGKILGINQSAVSNRLKRACFEEIMEVNEMYRHRLK